MRSCGGICMISAGLMGCGRSDVSVHICYACFAHMQYGLVRNVPF